MCKKSGEILLNLYFKRLPASRVCNPFKVQIYRNQSLFLTHGGPPKNFLTPEKFHATLRFMKSKEFTPIPLFTCILCKRPAYAGTEPFCVHCLPEVEKRELTKNKQIKRRFKLSPILHHLDRPILTKISRGATSPEWTYIQAWNKRKGKCSRCGIRSSTLRVIPSKHGVFIKSLVCPKCHKKSKPLKIEEAKTLEMIVWAKADPFMRFLLAQNLTLDKTC